MVDGHGMEGRGDGKRERGAKQRRKLKNIQHK